MQSHYKSKHEKIQDMILTTKSKEQMKRDWGSKRTTLSRRIERNKLSAKYVFSEAA